jgi:hypothetical protein
MINKHLMLAAMLSALATTTSAPSARPADIYPVRKRVRKVPLRNDPKSMSEIARWNAEADRKRAEKLARRAAGAEGAAR